MGECLRILVSVGNITRRVVQNEFHCLFINITIAAGIIFNIVAATVTKK